MITQKASLISLSQAQMISAVAAKDGYTIHPEAIYTIARRSITWVREDSTQEVDTLVVELFDGTTFAFEFSWFKSQLKLIKSQQPSQEVSEQDGTYRVFVGGMGTRHASPSMTHNVPTGNIVNRLNQLRRTPISLQANK